MKNTELFYSEIYTIFISLSEQVFWPASTIKVEECKMAGKDPTVSALKKTNLNIWSLNPRTLSAAKSDTTGVGVLNPLLDTW